MDTSKASEDVTCLDRTGQTSEEIQI